MEGAVETTAPRNDGERLAFNIHPPRCIFSSAVKLAMCDRLPMHESS